MSIRIMTAVFDRSKTRGAARLVLLALADNASDEGECYPAVATIAKKAAVSEITTREYLHAFEKIGLLKTEVRLTQDGRRTSNRYKIIQDKIGDDEITRDVIYSCRAPSKQDREPLSGLYRGQSKRVIPQPSNPLIDESSLEPPKESSTFHGEAIKESESPEVKPKRARSQKQQQADAEVKAVCEAFSRESGIPLPPNLFTKPSRQDVNQWIVQAKSVMTSHNGNSVDAIVSATRKHRAARDRDNNPLAMRGIRSVLWALPPVAPAPAATTPAAPPGAQSKDGGFYI